MSGQVYDLVIVGAGAAGHFAAAELLHRKPEASVLMLEKTGQVLSKVRISGGGRCNVTHHCFDENLLLQNYPRGNPWLAKVFSKFSVKDTMHWFQKRGVRIVAEADGRMFPESNQSDSIIQALRQSAFGRNFRLRFHAQVQEIHRVGVDGFQLVLKDGEIIATRFLLLASGGSPSVAGLKYLSPLELPMVEPVPSLFTFNIKQHKWSALMGLSVDDAAIAIPSAGLSFRGPVLITHWGFSGPAVLKLSAAAARLLYDCEYRFRFRIDFIPQISLPEVQQKIRDFASENPRQKPENAALFSIPRRLWEQLCRDSGLSVYHNWAEAGKKAKATMVALLKSADFEAFGKTTFKEEFVTSGGISLDGVHPETCESLRHPGLFFAGEILDVDGFTGGFNFQAAWSTAFAAARSISGKLNQE